jgi:hypothetical protein
MSADRRAAFARARWPVAVAMRVVAAALAEAGPRDGMRRSVFTRPRSARRVVAMRDTTVAPAAAQIPRGCEDLH